jgi:hypothetical protein
MLVAPIKRSTETSTPSQYSSPSSSKLHANVSSTTSRVGVNVMSCSSASAVRVPAHKVAVYVQL